MAGKGKPGRPLSDFKFTPIEKEMILSMFREGKIIPEVVATLGGAMHINTFRKHVDRDEEFKQQIREAKGEADDLVERSLFRRAVGYEVEEKEWDGQGNLVKRKNKHIYPEPQAGIFWLCNRRKDKWKMTTHVNATNLNIPGELADKSSSELARILIENERHHIGGQPGETGNNKKASR